MTEYYEVNWDPWVNYQVFDANGALVEISRPEAVTFDIPDEAKFGKMQVESKLLNTQALEVFGVLNGQTLILLTG